MTGGANMVHVCVTWLVGGGGLQLCRAGAAATRHSGARCGLRVHVDIKEREECVCVCVGKGQVLLRVHLCTPLLHHNEQQLSV